MRVGFKNPWWVVVGAVLGLMVGNGPVITYTFGVFLKPVMTDMGWDRGTASIALTTGSFCSAFAVPWFGRALDKYGIRRVALPAIVVYAALLAALGLAPRIFWAFALMAGLTGAASAIQTPLPYAKAIAAWFDRRRGRALGIAMAGVGLGAFILPQISQYAIGRFGWRGAYPILALLTVAIAVPAVALWIREPRPGEGERHESQGPLTGLTPREARGTRRFWILAAALFLVAMSINGMTGHIVPLLTDHGMSPARAAATLGSFGLATLAGRLLAGFLVDRFFAPYVASVFFLGPIAGFALLSVGSGPLPELGVILMGLGLGTEIDMIAFLATRYFGQKSFGEIYGIFFMTFGLGNAAGPLAAGQIYQMTGSYTPALTAAGVGLVLAVVCINMLGAYVYPVEHGRAGVRP